ncbi:hypothetical protein H4Q26_009142 [Puccinia striiformis f. sp. tritici PST-130]|nr:hypothetical protein H4Q26_009142 [Puccinia striiformis f. sp. tritici PST-130]
MSPSTRSSKTYESDASSIASSQRTSPSRQRKGTSTKLPKAGRKPAKGKDPIGVPTLIPTQPSPQRQKRSAPASEIKVVIPMSMPMATTAPRKVLAPKPKAAPAVMTNQLPVKVPNYPLIPGMTTVLFNSETSTDMDIDPMEVQDPTAEGDPSMDIVPTTSPRVQAAILHVPNGEGHQPSRRHEEDLDIVPTLVQGCIEAPHLAVRALSEQRLEPVQRGQAPQSSSNQHGKSEPGGELVPLTTKLERSLQQGQQTSYDIATWKNPQGQHPVERDHIRSPNARGIAEGGGASLQAQLDLQLSLLDQNRAISASIADLRATSEKLHKSRKEEQDKYESLTSDIDCTDELLQNVAVAVNNVSSSLANFRSKSLVTASQPENNNANRTTASDLSKDAPKVKNWPKFTGEGEYNHVEFIRTIDMFQEDFELRDIDIAGKFCLIFQHSAKKWYLMIHKIHRKQPWAWWKEQINTKWGNAAWVYRMEEAFDKAHFEPGTSKPLVWFSKQKDILSAIFPDMSESGLHERILKKCGGDLEHAVKCRTNRSSSTEDIINALEDIVERTKIGRRCNKSYTPTDNKTDPKKTTVNSLEKP